MECLLFFDGEKLRLEKLTSQVTGAKRVNIASKPFPVPPEYLLKRSAASAPADDADDGGMEVAEPEPHKPKKRRLSTGEGSRSKRRRLSDAKEVDDSPPSSKKSKGGEKKKSNKKRLSESTLDLAEFLEQDLDTVIETAPPPPKSTPSVSSRLRASSPKRPAASSTAASSSAAGSASSASSRATGGKGAHTAADKSVTAIADALGSSSSEDESDLEDSDGGSGSSSDSSDLDD